MSRQVLKCATICYVIIPKQLANDDFRSPSVIEKLKIQVIINPSCNNSTNRLTSSQTVLVERWTPGAEKERNERRDVEQYNSD